MLPILLKTLPFFMLIGLGWWAGRVRFFTPEATAYLTKFVFYFALSAMLFRFAANLSLADIWDAPLAAAYLSACAMVYLLAAAVALWRRVSVEEAAVEAQCAVIGNTGFLGIPMLTVLLGAGAAPTVLLLLAVDLIVFSSAITLVITGRREGRISLGLFRVLGLGLLKNPMIVSMVLGLAWSATALPVPGPVNDFLLILGAAATPGALFAIGASLAERSAERLAVAGWLTLCKLVLHPLAVAAAVYLVFPVETGRAGVAVAAAALPVAGNIFILAQHYRVAPQRVSAAILLSTTASILTVTAVVAWVAGGG
jgi:hypothetical protein